MIDTLQITIKSVYGRETIYPVCEQANRLAAMLGTKTLTQDAVRAAIGMGFQVQYIDTFTLKYATRSNSHCLALA